MKSFEQRKDEIFARAYEKQRHARAARRIVAALSISAATGLAVIAITAARGFSPSAPFIIDPPVATSTESHVQASLLAVISSSSGEIFRCEDEDKVQTMMAAISAALTDNQSKAQTTREAENEIYTVSFTLPDGTTKVYILKGDTLKDETEGGKATLDEQELSSLLEALGIPSDK